MLVSSFERLTLLSAPLNQTLTLLKVRVKLIMLSARI